MVARTSVVLLVTSPVSMVVSAIAALMETSHILRRLLVGDRMEQDRTAKMAMSPHRKLSPLPSSMTMSMLISLSAPPWPWMAIPMDRDLNTDLAFCPTLEMDIDGDFGGDQYGHLERYVSIDLRTGLGRSIEGLQIGRNGSHSLERRIIHTHYTFHLSFPREYVQRSTR